MVKPWVEMPARPLVKINPNWITVAGLVIVAGYAAAMAKQEYGWAMVLFLGSLGDMLDGTVARMSGRATKFGAVWDASLDRVSDGLTIMAFGWAGVVPWELVGLTMMVSLVISYVRAKYEAAAEGKDKLAVGVVERPERLLVIGLSTGLLALGFNPWVGGYNLVTWLMAGLLLTSVVTVGQRLRAAKKRLGAR